ncbi:hypothetical protein HPP92_023604 [Vanilla planifolia]|uniref:Uncharacterized protein n=1 Tax=Vanilla planifolia TaxID=51239 RepID=A0A835PVT6_VANPL|nr:hypothetical protein HPP92_023604 [Vanilla planifolia]
MKENRDLLLPASAVDAKLSAAAGQQGHLFRGRYKFLVLAAILLLAVWSILTGTVTLKWAAGKLNGISDDIDSSSMEDLDVLEVEEREKVVRHMWDVYTHGRRMLLPRFWQEVFAAAYEELSSDLEWVRVSAITEIARMTLMTGNLEPPPTSHPKISEAENSLNGGGETTKEKSSTD